MKKDFQRKEKAAALITLGQKSPGDLRGNPRRLIGTPDHPLIIALVEKGINGGCCRAEADYVVGISLRTYQRWPRGGNERCTDGRKGGRRIVPAKKLS
jgi:hypothetical protein